MILLRNSIVELNYEPATDILEAAYPDLHDYLLPEIKHTIDAMVEIIKNYDISKLLLDSSRTSILVSKERSAEISMHLAAGLAKTRLTKLARVQSQSTTVETTAQNNISQISTSLNLPFKLQNFTCKADALAWLAARD